MKDLSLHVLDILQNSIAADATLIVLEIAEQPEKDKYTLTLSDNGKGMDNNTLVKAIDPFFTSRTTRKVGLGLPLLKLNAERTGGMLNLQSQPGIGTTVTAEFGYSHIDRLPLGDIGSVIALTVSSWTDRNFVYTHSTPFGQFKFDSLDIKNALGNAPVNDPEVISFMKNYINGNLSEIKVS
jgi:hypothetical protein